MMIRRLFFLALLLAACTPEQPYASKKEERLPQGKRIERLTADSNAIHLRLGVDQQILIGEHLTGLDSLEYYLRDAYQQKGDTATVVLHLQRETPYGHYAEAQRVLEELLNAQRDSVSLARFNMHYEDLAAAKQQGINRTYHLRILERMKR